MSSFRGANQPFFLSTIVTCYHRLCRGTSSLIPSNLALRTKRITCFFDAVAKDEAETYTTNIPGPRKLPIIGSSWIYMKYSVDPTKQSWKLIDYLQERYGDVVAETLPGGIKIVHLYKPEDFEKVYRNDGPHPVRGIFPLICRFNAKYNNNLHGLSTSEGSYWKHIRSTVQQKLFKRKHTRGWFLKHLKVTDELLELLEKNKDNEGIVCDMNTILERYTLEVITSACFGDNFDENWTHLNRTQNGIRYLSVLKLVNKLLIESLFSFPWYKFIDTPFFKNYSKLNFQLDNLVEEKMQTEITRFQKCQNLPSTQNESLVYQLLEDNKLHKQEISTIIKDIIASSVFTLRSFLAFILYALADNPLDQNRIRKEIEDVLLKNNSEKLSQDTFDKMPFLKAFVKETLRCYPVIPGNVRKLDKDLRIKDFVLTEGTYVKMHHIYPSEDENQFENPSEFKPERWMRNSDQMNCAHPFAVTQFGFGPRSCLGKRIALTEAYLLITKILSNYTIEYPSDSFDIQPGLQYHPPNDLKFRFTKNPKTNY